MGAFGPFRAFLQTHGCELVSATEDISENEPEGRLKNNILLSVSDFERRNVAKKVRIKLRQQAKRGIWNGGMVPLGYDYDLHTQQLTPNPAEAALVRRIFEQAAQLVSLTDLANALNAEGHRTKRRVFVRRDGTNQLVDAHNFRSNGLRHLVTNPLYRGCVRFGGEEHAGRHEEIVPADLWERANAAVQNCAATAPKSSSRAIVMAIFSRESSIARTAGARCFHTTAEKKTSQGAHIAITTAVT